MNAVSEHCDVMLMRPSVCMACSEIATSLCCQHEGEMSVVDEVHCIMCDVLILVMSSACTCDLVRSAV